jgi:hypothetical protein
MTETIVSKILIRQGALQDMPILSPGEFGLARDEQRLFLGQAAVTGSLIETESDATIAVLEFATSFNGISTKLDLEEVNEFVITVNSGSNVPSNVVDLQDTKFYIPHGLGRIPTNDDVFLLYYNKEITSYRPEVDARLQSTYFQKTLGHGTPQATGITFLSATKNFVTLEYFITATGYMRKGTLDIGIMDGMTPTITDTYSADLAVIGDLVFSISAVSNVYSLDFDTTYNDQIQFNYVQHSFKHT